MAGSPADVKSQLIEDTARPPGTRILAGQFTAVHQAIGTMPDRVAAAAFLRDFVEEAKASGLVAQLIEKYAVAGRLTVAPPA